MAGFNYDAAAATALRLLTQFGGPMQVRQPTAPTSNPVAGTVTLNPVTLSFIGVRTRFKQEFFEGAVVQVGDQLWLLDGRQAPAPGSLLSVDGGWWPIVAVRAVKPSSTAVLYMAMVRK